MRRGKLGFFGGLISGVIITLFLLFGTLGFFVAANTASLGQAVEVIHKINTYSFIPTSAQEMIDGAIKGVVESLDDPYSAFLQPEEYQDLEEHLLGRYGGIGLSITETESNRPKVISPFKGTPAYRAGIKSGDLIIEVEGKDTTDMSLNEAANLMKGDPGTDVTLKVLPAANEEHREFVITRERITIPSVEGEVIQEQPRVGYINLLMFSQQTGRDLNEVLTNLNLDNIDGLILDLRNNPGGMLDGAVETTGYFIPEGPAVQIVSKNETKTLTTEDNFVDKPLVVLVNEGSASASEIVAGAIQDSGSGTIVGTNTFGKGLVQSVFETSGGAALKLTTAKYLTPAGHDIHEKGIEPDVEVSISSELAGELAFSDADIERDPQLRKAFEVLMNEI